MCVYRAKVCECLFGHAFVLVRVCRIMWPCISLVSMSLMGLGGGGQGGSKIFASYDTDFFFFFFYNINRMEVPARYCVILN